MRLSFCAYSAVLLLLKSLHAEAESVLPPKGQLSGHENGRIWTGRKLLELANGDNPRQSELAARGRALKGKFLHITDVHPDPLYRWHSSVAAGEACHRGKGPAGVYGAETTDCDSPLALVNATFKWIEENLKDEVDFVIWTGDSARHDNDELHPRRDKELIDLNQFVLDKFFEVWGNPRDGDNDPTNDFTIPIVPTYGNNDILPHNIFYPGPNKWTRAYLDIWQHLIPEEQRHSFEIGGWFYVEVIPNQLAVFSLNSLYFFDNNAAVNGCAAKSEPGYQQFEWLRIQLAFLRARGMKAIITGHVPPARTESKQSWDESCWQKYSLWMHQYRDVIVGSLWGHMNIDHFMLQDAKDVDMAFLEDVKHVQTRSAFEDEMTTESNADYLKDLRDNWAELPDPPRGFSFGSRGTYDGKNKQSKDKQKEFYKKIGGPWAERFSLGLVSPSVVPNYFPTIRIMEYNVSGLGKPAKTNADRPAKLSLGYDSEEDAIDFEWIAEQSVLHEASSEQILKKPKGPSKSSPPGPAYSPQTFTWLGFRQLYANITIINNDFTSAESKTDRDPNSMQYDEDLEGPIFSGSRWKEGKHPNKEPAKNQPSGKPNPKQFTFLLEYDTQKDSVYAMEDLTVRSYVELAWRIGASKEEEEEDVQGSSVSFAKKKKKHKKGKKDKKHKKGKKKKKHHHDDGPAESAWLTFVRRAFVGTFDEEELERTYGSTSVSKSASFSFPRISTSEMEEDEAFATADEVEDEDRALQKDVTGEDSAGISIEL